MKILVSNILAYEPFKKNYDAIEGLMRKSARSDSELIFKYVDVYTVNTQYSYFEYYNSMRMIENIIKGEKEGCDAAIPYCYNDPYLQVIKQAVNIPVIGLLGSSAFIAAMISHKFAAIPPIDVYAPGMEQKLIEYGFRDKLIPNPVRALGGSEWMLTIVDDTKKAISRLKEISKECIDDGAEAILPACGLLGSMCTIEGITEIEGVPLVDGAVTALKMAEMLVDLKNSPLKLMTSRKALYKLATKEEMKEFRKAFGLT